MQVPESPPSSLDRFFKISERGSNTRTEVRAGITTWLTMAYILFLNPAILGLVTDNQGTALPFDQVLTVTALVAGVMTIAMGVFGKYPFAIAAGLGLNAFVAFTLVGTLGLTWPEAMGVIVIEGVVIIDPRAHGAPRDDHERDPDGPEAGDRDRDRSVPRDHRLRERRDRRGRARGRRSRSPRPHDPPMS